MLGYNYEIIYKPRANNYVTDALCRVPSPAAQFFGITIPHFEVISKIQVHYKIDPKLLKLLEAMKNNPADYSDYTFTQGILLYRDKIYVPPNSDLKLLLIEDFHATPIGGHAGILKTFGRLSEIFIGQE